jgi:hypothetical protein
MYLAIIPSCLKALFGLLLTPPAGHVRVQYGGSCRILARRPRPVHEPRLARPCTDRACPDAGLGGSASPARHRPSHGMLKRVARCEDEQQHREARTSITFAQVRTPIQLVHFMLGLDEGRRPMRVSEFLRTGHDCVAHQGIVDRAALGPPSEFRSEQS